ncbi:MAG: hypothetical protein C0467_27640 [Planctomycetaceae bacterium]|nr:hypothetical protein [Planctomycetaceae bacterium]
MTKMTFFPLGNADSTLLRLADGRMILKDYCNYESAGEEDRRVRLDEELRICLREERRDRFDTVAFSHADDDHTHGAEDFFWLDHAEQYQGPGRVHIPELWVPACFILEVGATGTARIIRQEARYRFRKGQGIKVFGNPEPLEAWLRVEGIRPSERLHLIQKAGQCIPGFDRNRGQVEIFSHSPFSYRMEGDEVDRNGNSLVWHLTFFEGDTEYRCMLGADADHGAWANLILKTEQRGRHDRLVTNLFKVSHHSSYKSLAEEKGKDETTPRPEVARMFNRCLPGCILVSSSDPIPSGNTKQPPHRQAAAYYRRIARERGNEKNYIVTMEYPSVERPRPLIVDVTQRGFVVRRSLAAVAGPALVVSRPSPRLG